MTSDWNFHIPLSDALVNKHLSQLTYLKLGDEEARVDTSPIEKDYETWLRTLYPETYTAELASYHHDLWRWAWSIGPGTLPRPYVMVVARGWAKTTNAETIVVALGVRNIRRYCLYVSSTQSQADDHILSIAARLESDSIAHWYPAHSRPLVGKYDNQRGWRRNRLATAGGLTIDAAGLNTAIRGLKIENARPDYIILDDVDDDTDSIETIARKEDAITRRIIPAGAPNLAVLVCQNLAHPNGIVARLVDGRATYLARRIVSGPHPAIEGLELDGDRIVGGVPTWSYLDLEVCQAKIDDMGVRAFLMECQHDVMLAGTPRFSAPALHHLERNTRQPLPPSNLPPLWRNVAGLRVYELPRPGVPYVMYTDPAEGKGRDYTATGVMEARSRTLVAVLEDNTREPQEHANIATELWEAYNHPLTGYERAKGEAIAWVYGQNGVHPIYQHEDTPLTPQQKVRGRQRRLRPGFPMTPRTKRALIDRLATSIDTSSIVVPDARTVHQLQRYIVTEDMKTEAAAGEHDDLVIMLAGLVMLAEEPRAQIVSRRSGEPRAPKTYSTGFSFRR